MVPADQAWDYTLVLDESDRELRLADPLLSRLGRSSYLTVG